VTTGLPGYALDSVSTTQLCTHVSIGPLKAVHERCHPGAGNRPPRTPWPPDDERGWEERADVLLAELESDEADA